MFLIDQNISTVFAYLAERPECGAIDEDMLVYLSLIVKLGMSSFVVLIHHLTYPITNNVPCLLRL